MHYSAIRYMYILPVYLLAQNKTIYKQNTEYTKIRIQNMNKKKGENKPMYMFHMLLRCEDCMFIYVTCVRMKHFINFMFFFLVISTDFHEITFLYNYPFNLIGRINHKLFLIFRSNSKQRKKNESFRFIHDELLTDYNLFIFFD